MGGNIAGLWKNMATLENGRRIIQQVSFVEVVTVWSSKTCRCFGYELAVKCKKFGSNASFDLIFSRHIGKARFGAVIID